MAEANQTQDTPQFPQKPGFRAVDLSIPVDQLPRWIVLLSVVLLIVPLLPYALLYGVGDLLSAFDNIVPMLLGFIALIIAHEAVHAIGWKYASGLPWSNFTFGIIWKALAPYCHATAPMQVQPYRIGAAAPGVVTGLLPWLLALIMRDPTLMIVSAVMISAAVGDIYVLTTLHDLPGDAEVLDHPSHAGCVVYLPHASDTDIAPA